MIGKAYIWNRKIGGIDFWTMKNKIKIPFRSMTWMGWQPCKVGIHKTCGCKKKLHFTLSTKGIKVTSHNYRFTTLRDNAVQMFQLLLSVPELQRKMNDENTDLFKLHFNNQPLHSFIKIVKAMINNFPASEETIPLFI